MKKVITVMLMFVQYGFAQTSEHIDSAKVISLEEAKVVNHQSCTEKLHKFYCKDNLINTEEILARLPEVSMIRRGAYGMEPLIRGFNTGQVSVLIDGMRVHGACTDKMDPVSIYVEPANVKSIQLQTEDGFVSGSNIGGALNLQLAQPVMGLKKRMSGNISSVYQANSNAVYESSVIHFSQQRWALRANFSYRKSNDYTDGNHSTVSYSGFQKINYAISGIRKFKNNWLAKFDWLMDEGWNIGYASLPMDVGYAGAKIASVSVLKNYINKPVLQWEGKVYWNVVRHFMDDTHRKDVVMHMDMPGLSKTGGAYIDIKFVPGKHGQLLLKGDLSSTFLQASMTMYQPGQPSMYMLTWPDNQKVQTGISAVYNYRTSNTTFLKFSARTDYILYALRSQLGKDQLSVLNYSTGNIRYCLNNLAFAFNKKCNEKLNIVAGLSYSERAPTASELYGFYLFNNNDGYDYLGNLNLKKEDAIQVHSGLSFSTAKFRLSWNTYLSYIDHYIIGERDEHLSTMTIGANGVKVYHHLSNAILAGTEATLLYVPVDSWQWVATGKYMLGEDDHGQALPLINPFTAILSVQKKAGHFIFSAESEIAVSQRNISDYNQEQITPGYCIAGIKSAYRMPIKNDKSILLSLSVDNILNAAYKKHLDWGKVYRPGRNVVFQCQYSF